MSDVNKVAIVTGASQGLGEGIVNGYRARGYGVVATSRSIQPSTDPNLVTVAGDIGDPATGKRLVAAALEKFGRIDTLVNNAGIFIGKAFTDYTEDDCRLKLKTNLDGSEAAVAAWHDKPTFYAISAKDQMIPPEAEAMFAKRMHAQTVMLQSSHASPVSHPAEVAALIERAAR